MSATAPSLPPPLTEGERLTGEEFLRRWEAMPDLKRAELIDGIVHMPSPVGYAHNFFHGLLTYWLVAYGKATPGCQAGIAGTWLMSPTDIPQPDLTLRRLPAAGGQSTIVNGYLAGAPELAIEISESTSSRDQGRKAETYLSHGVKEYLIFMPAKQEASWREASGGRFRRIAPHSDGTLRSRVFPGLWLNTAALIRGDVDALEETLRQGLAERVR